MQRSSIWKISQFELHRKALRISYLSFKSWWLNKQDDSNNNNTVPFAISEENSDEIDFTMKKKYKQGTTFDVSIIYINSESLNMGVGFSVILVDFNCSGWQSIAHSLGSHLKKLFGEPWKSFRQRGNSRVKSLLV